MTFKELVKINSNKVSKQVTVNGEKCFPCKYCGSLVIEGWSRSPKGYVCGDCVSE